MTTPSEPTIVLRRPIRDTWPPLVWLVIAVSIAMAALMLAPNV